MLISNYVPRKHLKMFLNNKYIYWIFTVNRICDTWLEEAVGVGWPEILHCCCGKKGDIISNPVEKSRTKIINMTTEVNFIDPKTVRDMINRIKGLGDVIISLCTGGPTWQRLNLSFAHRHGWEYTLVKLFGIWDLHRRNGRDLSRWSSTAEQISRSNSTIGVATICGYLARR